MSGREPQRSRSGIWLGGRNNASRKKLGRKPRTPRPHPQTLLTLLVDAVEGLRQSGERVGVGAHIALDRGRFNDQLRASFQGLDELGFLSRILDPGIGPLGD